MSKNDTSRIFRLVSIGFAMTGACLLVGGLLTYRATADFLEHAVSSTGNVVSIYTSTDSHGVPTYYPIIEFRTRQGESVEFQSSSGSRPSEHRIGSQLPILYDPANPKEAEISSFFSLWLGTLVLSVLGAGFAGAGLSGLILFFDRRSIRWRRTAHVARQ